MKKYLVFCGDVYYPCRGVHDFKFSADTMDEVDKGLEDIKKDYLVWWQIVDRDTFEIIREGENR